VLSWNIGKLRITRIVEIPDYPKLLERYWLNLAAEDLEPYREWLAPYITETGDAVLSSVHSFVVEAKDTRTIIDTCVGNGKYYGRRLPEFNNLQTEFLEDLSRAGFPPDTIDTVVCTHLHMDHIGWNTLLLEGRWVPTFPKARYVIPKIDLDYWAAHDPRPQVFAEAVQPLLDASLVDAVASTHRIHDNIDLVPTPGHSPGHSSVRLHSQGEEALITGDMVHSPVQFRHPEWSSTFDYDATQAEQSRRSLLAKATNKGILVLGTHFPSPTGGLLVDEGMGVRFVGRTPAM